MAGGNSTANAIALQPDGKILVGGRISSSVGEGFALARYHPNGTLDTSFNIDGLVLTDLPGTKAAIETLAVAANGKIYAAGSVAAGAFSSSDVAIAAYLPNGDLDPSFSGHGLYTASIGAGSDVLYSIVIQSDGNLLLGGATSTSVSQANDGLLMRMTPAGALDTAFGTGGRVIADLSGASQNDIIRWISLRTDGKFVACGNWVPSGSVDQGTVARFNSNGTLDTSFSGDGKLAFQFASGVKSVARAVVSLPDGRVLISGNTSVGSDNSVGVARFTSAGVLDTTFNGTGLKVHSLGPWTSEMGASLVVLPDGRFLVSGDMVSGTGSTAAWRDLFLMRFWP
jgi:uncharacterized delta-60 repeat protein